MAERDSHDASRTILQLASFGVPWRGGTGGPHLAQKAKKDSCDPGHLRMKLFKQWLMLVIGGQPDPGIIRRK
jgi:hypothetical protein